MSHPTTQPPSVTPGTSAVRLAMALRQFATAQTLADIVAAKDRAKSAGLSAKDTQTLRAAFDGAKAKFKEPRP